MRKRPLLYLACVFAAGLCCRNYGKWFIPAALLLFGYEIHSITCGRGGKHPLCRLLVMAAVFFISVFHMQSELSFRERELSQIRDGGTAVIQGEIYKKEIKKEQTVCYLKDAAAVLSNGTVLCNHVIAYLNDGEDHPIGETLLLNGKINRFQPASNEGGFDAEKFYASQKIDFALWDAACIKSDGEADALGEGLFALRNRIFGIYQGAMEEADSGVLSVMLLGDKSGLDPELKALYQDSGISHVLAISGLHISLIGMGVYRFLRKRRFGCVKAGGAALLLVVSYTVMSGSGVSARRAAGMFLFAVLADALGRAYDPLNALGGMILFLLWENPFLLEYTGFLFSVTAIFGITITGRIFCLEQKDGKTPGRRQRAQNALYSGLGLWLTTLPLVAYCYYEVPVYSMGLNLLVLPLLPFLFFFGIWSAVVGLLFPRLAFWTLLPCRWILAAYRLMAGLSLKLPGAQQLAGKPLVGRICAYYALLFLLCIVLRRRKEKAAGQGSFFGHLARGGGAVLLFLFLARTPEREFELDVLDVGQGDGIYLCTEDGVSLFIDGGSSSEKEVGRNCILPFLKSRGISHISYWFVSHADQDHISGLKEVLESGYPVDALVIAGTERDAGSGTIDDEAMLALVQLAESRGTQILTMKAGESLAWERSEIRCLFPGEECAFSDRNDRSLVLLYQDAQFRGIFTGDISAEAEKLLAESGLLRDVDFYKAAHHGSDGSNSEVFLQALQPKIAAVSCGADNSYGHPGEEAVRRMEEAGARIFLTMRLGQICVTRDGVEGFVK